jgi:hypothetical protein
MKQFIKSRSTSLSMVVAVLLGIILMQSEISYTITFGRLDQLISPFLRGALPVTGLVVRSLLLLTIIGMWILNRKRLLFKTIIFVNSLLTLGLLMNLTSLADVLRGITSHEVEILLTDVVLLATSNILIFSIWYWIIDPPGVEENPRDNTPWEFLFPQRADAFPHYENWMPRYTDYLFLAFTSSFAFSPTDTLPLTRRAKILMMIQASISLITITGIASSAISILAGGQ